MFPRLDAFFRADYSAMALDLMPTFYHMEQIKLIILFLKGSNLFGNMTHLYPTFRRILKGLDYLIIQYILDSMRYGITNFT